MQEALRRSEDGRERLRSALLQARADAENELRLLRKQLRSAEELLARAERYDEGAGDAQIVSLREKLEALGRSHMQLCEGELAQLRSALGEATRRLADESESSCRLRVELAEARAETRASAGESRAPARAEARPESYVASMCEAAGLPPHPSLHTHPFPPTPSHSPEHTH